MKISILLFLACQTTIEGFSPFMQHSRVLHQNKGSTATPMAEKSDDYDDWYADFDPSNFDSSNQGYEKTSKQADHDYTRDTSADQSNVDVDAVNYLIAERLTMRKTGRFDEADAIRDELMKKHGVMVRDKERMWRSGCSTSGSGGRWQPGGRQPGGRQSFQGDRRGKPKPSFGPNGHDYNMARGAGPIQSTLSEKEIHQLLAERLQCKLDRDYGTADAIQNELLAAGVLISDKKKEWRADGATWDEYSARAYVQSPNSAPTDDVQDIQAMVAERAAAKAERLFQKADAIRDDLLDKYDVVIDDRRLEWSVGGDFGVPANTKKDEFIPFGQAPGSPPVDNHDEIQELVEERDTARAARDFDRADEIRDDLMAQNVYIDDRKRQWALGGFPKERDDLYSRRGGGNISEEDVQKINELLQKRLEYKKDRKFKSADSIRDRLRDEFQVQIDDRAKEWHVVTNDYVMAQSSATMDDETKDLIQNLVDQRAVAKLQKDYSTADSIRDVLMQRYQVSVDDRLKEWIKLAISDENSSSFVDHDEEDDWESADDESLVEVEPEASGGGAETTEEELEKLTIPELKEKLRAADLPVSGKKAELIERLMS